MFRPSLHGWPFRNTHSCTGPELGLGGTPPAQLGLSGGMCWAALDRYLRGAGIPWDTGAPEAGDPLHAELVQRQVAALAGVWPTVEAWQRSPDGSWRDRLPIPVPFGGDDVASRTRARWRELRGQLDAGRPVLVTLLLRADGYRRSRAVRQVLATGWSKLGPRIALSVYDPDCPGDDDIRLSFNTAGPLDARLSGESNVRGFFPVPYDRTPSAAVRVEAFDDRSVIGLNRTVRGIPAPTAGRKRLDLVARNGRGALLHFYRRSGEHWEGVNVTEAEDFGAPELHSDPAAFQRAGVLHVFARSYVGDLLHFRRGRTWSVTNRTEHKRAGARFRLAGRPVPVPGPRLDISVLGRDASGGLVHYFARPFRGWRAEQVPGDPVSSDPIAARNGGPLHVIGVAGDGRLLHWVRDEAWRVTDTEAGEGPEVRLTGTPVLRLRHGRVHVFGRGRDGHLVRLVLGGDGAWKRARLAEGITGDPVVASGPAGFHVFAPTGGGGVIHAWEAGDGWAWEDVLDSRPTLPVHPSDDHDLACWATGREMRVFVRRHRTLRVLTWTPDADWVVDTVAERVDGSPALIRDARGRPHVIFTDGGTAIHVETGPWREPSGRPLAVRRSIEPSRAADEAETAEAEAEPTPEPVDATPETEAEPSPAPPPSVEELPEPEPTDADSGVLDFEAEALLRSEPQVQEPQETDTPEEAAPEDLAQEAAAQEPVADPEPGEPVAAAEPEEPATAPRSAAPTLEGLPPLDDPEEADADPEGEDADPDRNEEPAPKREFRWEDEKGSVSPEDVEPIDLSTLDGWPPVKPSRSRRSDRKRENAGGPDADREAS